MLLRQLQGNDGQDGEAPALRSIVLAEMELAAPILNFAEFYQITGNADTKQRSTTGGAGAMRAIGGSDFSEDASSFSEASSTLRIFGDVIGTDIAIVRRGYTVEDTRISEVRQYAKKLGKKLFYEFVNGDNIAPNIYGLKTICVDEEAGADTQTVELGTGNGDTVDLGSDNTAKKKQQTFLEKLDEMIAKAGSPSCLIMSAAAKARLVAIGREYVTTTRVQDIYGRDQIVQDYYGIPIVVAGYSADDTTPILPATETLGTSSDCQSIYAVKFGEASDLTLPTSVGLVVKNEGLVGNKLKTRVELDLNLFPVSLKSFARLKGIRLA